MNELKALVFDLDGVLTDTAELHYFAWKRLADELGLAFNREQNEALKGISRVGSLRSFCGIIKNAMSIHARRRDSCQPKKRIL